MKEKNSPKTREEFLMENARFLDNGLMKELFYNDNVSILNLADTSYVVTDYSRISDGFIGFVFDKEVIRYIASYDGAFYAVCSTMSKDAAKNQLIVFDETTYKRACEYQQKTSKEGPSRDIDKSLDDELLDRKEKEYGGNVK